MNTKVCSVCGVEKPVSDFYAKPSTPDKPIRQCRTCQKQKAHEYYKSLGPEKMAERAAYRNRTRHVTKVLQDRYYASEHGRAMTLLKSAKRRASSKSIPFELDIDFVAQKLRAGVCEVTGISFDLSRIGDYKNHPFAPSLDRINPTGPYTKDNVRMTIWQFNAMKGQMDDAQLLVFCEVIIGALHEPR